MVQIGPKGHPHPFNRAANPQRFFAPVESMGQPTPDQKAQQQEIDVKRALAQQGPRAGSGLLAELGRSEALADLKAGRFQGAAVLIP